MVELDLILICMSYSIGIIFSLIVSYLVFNSTFPHYKIKIINERIWVESLEKLFKLAKKEIIFTTLAFSTLDIHKRIELALDDALLRGIKIDIIGARGIMPEGRYNKLKRKGCNVILIPKIILDRDDKFWHHLMVVDSKHWLWIHPHEPEKREVHFGYYKLFDIDNAKKYREKLVQLKRFENITEDEISNNG